jgi:hypothetical protein
MLIVSVLFRKRGVGAAAKTPKYSNNQCNQVTSVVKRDMDRNSSSRLEQENVVCFFIFRAMSEPPRNT